MTLNKPPEARTVAKPKADAHTLESQTVMLDSMKPNLLELETDCEEEQIPANPTVISDYQQGRTSTADHVQLQFICLSSQ